MQSKQFQDSKLNEYIWAMKDTNAVPNSVENFGKCSNYPKAEPWGEKNDYAEPGEDLLDQYLYENNFYQKQYFETQRPDFDLESEYRIKGIDQLNEIGQQYDRMGAVGHYPGRVKKLNCLNDGVEGGVPT